MGLEQESSIRWRIASLVLPPILVFRVLDRPGQCTTTSTRGYLQKMSAPTPQWLTNLNLPDLPESQSHTQVTSPSSTSDALGGGDADLDWMNSLEAWTTFDFGQPQQPQLQAPQPSATEKPSTYKEYKKRTQDGTGAGKGFDVPGFGHFLGLGETGTAADGSNVVNGAAATSEMLELPDFALGDSVCPLTFRLFLTSR